MNKQSLDIEDLEKKASEHVRTVVYPEGHDPRVLKAVRQLTSKNLVKAVLISNNGDVEEVARKTNTSLDNIDIVPINDQSKLRVLTAKMQELQPDLSDNQVNESLRDRLVFASLLVRTGDVDAMVAGVEYTTKDVARAGIKLIGLKPGIKLASSFFIMSLPLWRGPDGNRLVYADAGFNIAPNANGLADIAIATADSSENILGWRPRVAFLSFSTKGSADDASIERIKKALQIVHERRPDIFVDGELQADSALVPDVAVRKIKQKSEVAGKANVLIFPDLNSGNIAYKLTERLANAHAYGPIMQGFAKPLSDLSRGSTVEDIVGVSVCVALQVED